MKTSYFRIDRGIQNHWLWEDKPFSRGQAWIDLILMATHTDKKTLYRGSLISRKRGEVYTSIEFLANRWGWSKNKVKRFLRTLEGEQMITTKGSTNGTTLTIEKYAFYQSSYTTKGSAERPADEPADGPPNEPPDGSADEPADGPQTKKNKERIIMINNDQKGKRELEALRERIKSQNDAWRLSHPEKEERA